jgi:two-component system, response regulator
MSAPPVQILVAENHPGDAELILETLVAEGLAGRVHVVTSGREVLDFLVPRAPQAAAPATPPCVVLLELDLPEIGGLDVLRALKSDSRTRAIPVVVFAASGLERDLVECYRLGANSYVQKPGEFAAFSEAVRRVVRYWLETNHPPPNRAFGGDAA